MIAYKLVITEGCIHKPFMEVKLGDKLFGIDCIALRKLIRKANKIGVYQVIENLDPEDNGMFAMLYEEFKHEL